MLFCFIPDRFIIKSENLSKSRIERFRATYEKYLLFKIKDWVLNWSFFILSSNHFIKYF